MQEFNLGGVGQRVDRPHHERQMQRFKDNIAECGLDISTIHIMKSDSLTLNASDIRESMGKDFQKFSFFSVDGCHEFTHAYHDIGLAFELTASNGLIMVDDYYNPTWPGVHEAVAKHFFGAAPLFVPLFWVRNKLALCHVNYHSVFLEGLQNYLSENFDEMPIRKAVRYGWETLSIEPRDGTPLIL